MLILTQTPNSLEKPNWTVQLLNRITPDEVYIASRTLWLDKQIAYRIAEDALEIIAKTYMRKFSFFNGKTSRGLVGGLFYLLGYKHNVVKNQKELADRLGTSDVTIRASYRNWLETFPDLFLDVISKLGQDPNLRYYVLTDLKQKISAYQLFVPHVQQIIVTEQAGPNV